MSNPAPDIVRTLGGPPALTGTVKQVAYATALRDRALNDLAYLGRVPLGAQTRAAAIKHASILHWISRETSAAALIDQLQYAGRADGAGYRVPRGYLVPVADIEQVQTLAALLCLRVLPSYGLGGEITSYSIHDWRRESHDLVSVHESLEGAEAARIAHAEATR